MLLLILLALLLAAPAGAQCCGDCDGNGAVDIADLVRAVNAALDAETCGMPTDGCPYSFDTLTTTRRCAFAGRFHPTCGGPLQGVVAGDGDVIAVALGTMPAVGFIAERTSATTATLIAWSVEPFTSTTPTSGTVELRDGRARLILTPDAPPFRYLGCDFLTYDGHFTQTVGRQNFTRTR